MKIAFISQPEYFRFCYEQDLSTDYEVREFPFHFGMREEELADLVDFDADVNFFFRGEFFPAALLPALRGKKIALSSEPFPRHLDGTLEYTRDSIKRYLDFRSRIRTQPFDYVFHYDEASLRFMARDGLNLSGAFAFPVATETYVDSKLDAKWDIFFIGRSTQHRERFFGPLKHHFQFLHICHGIFGPPLIEYMARAKINLNVHAESEISWEPRMQMLLATGAFVISEPITPNRYLRPGIDYVEATSPSDMYEKVAYYLEHENERLTIASSGKARIRELLSAKTNFPQLIHDLEQGKYSTFKTSRSSTSVNALARYFDFESRVRASCRKLLK
ncbi:glycosyltransferase family protein [Achromobacter ruhlandii]|uniref:glycosyltransferase family protein n=1 Tax=Achromobacter ruhlandii TaxID=72557 RepID=UPI003BA1F14A